MSVEIAPLAIIMVKPLNEGDSVHSVLEPVSVWGFISMASACIQGVGFAGFVVKLAVPLIGSVAWGAEVPIR